MITRRELSEHIDRAARYAELSSVRERNHWRRLVEILEELDELLEREGAPRSLERLRDAYVRHETPHG